MLCKRLPGSKIKINLQWPRQIGKFPLAAKTPASILSTRPESTDINYREDGVSDHCPLGNQRGRWDALDPEDFHAGPIGCEGVAGFNRLHEWIRYFAAT
jgi:hypothetical protein